MLMKAFWASTEVTPPFEADRALRRASRDIWHQALRVSAIAYLLAILDGRFDPEEAQDASAAEHFDAEAPAPEPVVPALPAGVSLNTSTGAITGTPTTAGSYPIIVQVNDGLGLATKSFILAVNESEITFITEPTDVMSGQTMPLVRVQLTDGVGTPLVGENVDLNLGTSITREDKRTLTELGYLLNLARQDFDMPLVLSVIIIIVAFVYSTDRLIFTPIQAHLARHHAAA